MRMNGKKNQKHCFVMKKNGYGSVVIVGDFFFVFTTHMKIHE